MATERHTKAGSFLKKQWKRCLGLCFVLFVVAAYFYYWFGILKSGENYSDADISENVTDEVLYEEPVEWQEEDISDDDLTTIHVQEHSDLEPEVDNLPPLDDVVHVSALLKLQSLDEGEKKTSLKPQPVVNDKKNGRPRIAIVIDDMGASPVRTNEIIALKAPLTSSFVTFAAQLNKQTARAEQAGHELMIHVPMQPKSDIFVSNDVLTIDMTEAQISQAFAQMLKKFHHVVGVNNHMGSRFTEHADKLVPVMKLLAKSGLFFLDSKTTAQSQGESVAKKYGVPSVHRHVFLDNENNLEYILRQLELTEKIARQNGYAIAIGHPKTQTSKALSAWLKTLDKKYIELVHLSELVREFSSN